MKSRVPVAAAFLALALTACQAQEPPVQAQAAPADAIVATAVSDVRSAAIDPVTGKARDVGAVFTAASDTTALSAPGTTLGGRDAGAPSSTLDLAPGTGGSGQPSL